MSTAVTPGAEPAVYTVAGQLSFREVTRTVEFSARIVVTPDEVTVDGTLTLSQTEFGMTEAARKIKDEVPVKVSVRGRRR